MTLGPGNRGKPRTLAVNPRCLGSGVGADDSRADGPAHQACYVVDVEPVHDLAAVRLDGLDGEVEPLSDLLAGEALGHELKDLPLPRGEEVEHARLAHPPQVFVHDVLRDGGRQVRFAPRHRLESQLELGDVGPLEEIAGGAGAQRLGHVLLGGVHREDQDARAGGLFGDAGGRLEAVETRHGDVHDDDIGAVEACQLEGFAPVRRLRDHVDPADLAQHRADALTNQGVVLGEQDTQGSGGHGSVRGNRAHTVVPVPGWESIRKSPPSSRTRSSMPSSPIEPSAIVPPRTAATSEPVPSSRTVRSNGPSSARASTSTRLAPAWRATLVMASCATRKHAVSRSEASRSVGSCVRTRTARPARRPWRSAYQRRAAASPRSSSTEGRSSSDMERSASISCSTIATLSSSGNALAPRPPRAPLRSDSRFSFTAVSAWPI